MSDEPRVYSWDTWRAGPDGVTFGACGVSDDRILALTDLGAALRAEPGYLGQCSRATLDLFGSPRYIYDRGVVIWGRHDRASGCVLWTKADEPSLDPSFWPVTGPAVNDGSEP